MLLQFPFICHRKLNRTLLFSVYIHLQCERLVRKGLNLFMEKESTRLILPLELLAQLLSWNRTATYKGKMYSSMRQLLLCIIAGIISVHDRELQDPSPACKFFPTPSCYKEFILRGCLCYRSKFISYAPWWGLAILPEHAAFQSSAKFP